MAEQYPNKSVQVSHVQSLKNVQPLRKNASGFSAHEDRRWARQEAVARLAANDVHSVQAKDALFIPLPLWFPPTRPPLNDFDHEDAENQCELFRTVRGKRSSTIDGVEEPQAASRLSWQPIEVGYGGPPESGEPGDPSRREQEWPLSVDVAPPTGMVVASV